MSKPLESLPRALTTLGVVAATVLVSVYAFVNGNYALMVGVVIAAPMVAMINNPPAWIIAIVGLWQSNMIVPGLPRGLQLLHLFMAGFCALVVARNIVLKPPRERSPLSFLFIWALLGLFVFIITQRGFGLMMTGGSTIGGSVYLKVFIMAGYLLCSRYILLTTKQWRLAIGLLFAGSLLPVAAEAIFTLSHGAIQFQYLFIEPYVFGLLDTLGALTSGSGVVRFTSLAPLATILVMLALIFTPRKSGFTAVTYLLLGLSLLVAGLSGFRSLILDTLGIIVLYRVFMLPRGRRLQNVIIMGGGAVLFLVCLIPFVQYLPFSIQRAVAWLPFATIDPIAMADANISTQWRLDLWKFCLQNASDYLWVGRGLTINTEDLYSLGVVNDRILNPWFGHAYHNGPISLLIDTGIPGLVLASLYMLFAAREVLTNRLRPDDPFIARFFVYVKARIIFSILSFYFVAGSVESMTAQFFYLAIFYGLQVTSVRYANRRTRRDFAIIDPSFGSAPSERPLRNNTD